MTVDLYSEARQSFRSINLKNKDQRTADRLIKDAKMGFILNFQVPVWWYLSKYYPFLSKKYPADRRVTFGCPP